MTTIGRSITITGELTSDEDLTIDGQVDGHVLVRKGTLTLGDAGKVEADIRGVRILVKGHVKGSIAASERIELAPTASVDGNLSANQVVMGEGARFNGRIDMDQRTIAARVAQFKASQA